MRAGHPHQHDRPRDPGQVPAAAGARRRLERRLPGGLEQLEPVHLIAAGLVQVLGLDAHRHVPAADRHAQVHRAVAQVLAERRVRHQQLRDQLAAGPDRQLARVPGQVENPPRGRRRGAQHQARGHGQVAVRVSRGELAGDRVAHDDRHADRAGLPGGSPAPGAGLALGVQPELDADAERAAHRQAQAVQVGPGLVRLEHRGQALLGPGERPLGAAAGLSHDRLDQPGQLDGGRHREERDAGPLGDVGRGHRRLPPLGGEGGDRRDVVDGRPAQRHVEPVVGGRRGRAPRQDDQAPGGRVVQVGELLGQPHRHDLAVPAAAGDPLQAGQGRAGQDLVNGRHALIMRIAQLVA